MNKGSLNIEPLRLEHGGVLQREAYEDGTLIVRITGQTDFPLDTLDQIDARITDARIIAERARFPEYSGGDLKETLVAMVDNGIGSLFTPFVMDANLRALSGLNSVEHLLVPSPDLGEGMLSLERLSGPPKVVAFFHGYHQFSGAGAQFMIDAAKTGMQGISKGYNYMMPTEDFSEKVLLPLIHDIEKAGGVLVGAVGHSTGADNLSYAVKTNPLVQGYAREHGTRFVFSSPLTTGMGEVLNPAQRSLKWIFPEKDDLTTEAGKRQFAKLNQPSPEGIDAYTLLCQNDCLVVPTCGVDTNNGSVNVMIPRGGHFFGSGIRSYVNFAALGLVAYGVPDPK